MKFVPPHSDRWPDHLEYHKKNLGTFEYLEENDVFQSGDMYTGLSLEYGEPFVVGGCKTSTKSGDLVRREQLCYLPRRLRNRIR